jgi:hypothetical protein
MLSGNLEGLVVGLSRLRCPRSRLNATGFWFSTRARAEVCGIEPSDPELGKRPVVFVLRGGTPGPKAGYALGVSSVIGEDVECSVAVLVGRRLEVVDDCQLTPSSFLPLGPLGTFSTVQRRHLS